MGRLEISASISTILNGQTVKFKAFDRSYFTRGAHLCRLQQLSVVKVFETASSAVQGRLWLVWLMTLSGLPLVLQAALCDGLAFDPFSLQQDCLTASEVDVGRR